MPSPTNMKWVNTRTCNPDGDKNVMIYKFFINGDDGDAGPNGEYSIHLDGKPYYPLKEDDCTQDPKGYCKYRMGWAHNIENAYFTKLEKWKSLTVGIEEQDIIFNNDSASVSMTSAEWFRPTCDTYEVILSKSFYSGTQGQTCNDLIGETTADESEDPNFISCSNWADPPQSYIWYVKVEPIEFHE